MRLHFAIDFATGGTTMPSDWAAQAARRFLERQTAQDQAEAVLLEKRRILEEQSPGLWQQVCNRVQVLVAEFNAQCSGKPMEYVNVSTIEFRVRFTTPRHTEELTAAFEASSSQGALKWRYKRAEAKSGGCGLAVSSFTGKVSFIYDLAEKSPEEIAEQMLAGLIGE